MEWRQAFNALEQSAEIMNVGVTDLFGNLPYRQRRMKKQIFCPFHPDSNKHLDRRLARLFLKQLAKAARGQMNG